FTQGPVPFGRAIESALLSKLRAPVADERAAFEKWTGYTEDALSRDAGDGYCIKGVDNQWRAWQASHAALASAPVAGEAQLSEYRRGVMDAFHLANMANANRQGRTAEETCAHLVRSLADLANGDAVPQASEAVRSYRDSDDFHNNASTNELGAWQRGWDDCREADQKQVSGAVRKQSAAFPAKPLGIFCAGKWTWSGTGQAFSHTDLDEAAFVAYRDALSAQPGAQKDCNCATCRPHSVEIRMILCEVCGDKRCPHAADHRNECTGTGAQKKGDSNG
ncbi:hypothetical protein, partial [Achromobacter aegrifaciens]|uniref:hypothetical protein n=1 Tax=Achromobacter aegrifaciens TaxID=1287736 RepID=UPI000FB1BC78